MGTRERQERERRAMEEEIIATALAMVRAEGAANLSLRRVAERMEYSSAALYRYFKDKAALVDVLCERGFADLGVRLRAVPTDLPAAERLRAQGEAYLSFAAEEPHLYTLMFVDILPGQAATPTPPPEVLINDVAFGELYRVLAEGAASGAFRLTPPAILPAAIAAWALVHGYAMLRTRYPDALTLDLASAGLRALAAGLAGAADSGAARAP